MKAREEGKMSGGAAKQSQPTVSVICMESVTLVCMMVAGGEAG